MVCQLSDTASALYRDSCRATTVIKNPTFPIHNNCVFCFWFAFLEVCASLFVSVLSRQKSETKERIRMTERTSQVLVAVFASPFGIRKEANAQITQTLHSHTPSLPLFCRGQGILVCWIFFLAEKSWSTRSLLLLIVRDSWSPVPEIRIFCIQQQRAHHRRGHLFFAVVLFCGDCCSQRSSAAIVPL